MTKDKALQAAKRLAVVEGVRKVSAIDSRRARDAAALNAADLGATQREIAEAIGLTIDRVTQVLRRERDRRADA